MFTQCPNCHQKQSLTVEQLRNSRAIVHCSQCAIMFDALELINEAKPESNKEKRVAADPLADLPWEKPASSGKVYWRPGAFLGLLLLAGQAVYFEGSGLSQSARFRPGLEKLCQRLSCQLPPYKKLDELTVLHGALKPLPDRQYEFRAIINNQAAFTQPYPNINLTLLDYTGKPFTHRIFRPQEYLVKNAETALSADATLDINLKIAATETRIGGYNFELTY